MAHEKGPMLEASTMADKGFREPSDASQQQVHIKPLMVWRLTCFWMASTGCDVETSSFKLLKPRRIVS